MKGRAVPYSAEELAWLEENQSWPLPIWHRIFVMFFERRDVTVGNLKALRARRGWATGRTGRFEKGAVPANKGKRCPEGKGGRSAASRRTQFQRGREPGNTKWLGHERMTKDGYVMVSVAETNPHTGYHRRYVLKHRWLWERANGKLAQDHCLKCLDGNRQNCDPANWIAVPRGLLPRLSGRWTAVAFDDAPAELKPVILAAAKLRHGAREAAKRSAQQ